MAGVVAGYDAYGILSNRWADYTDSADSTYLPFGLPFALMALVCLTSAMWMLRKP